MITRTFVDKTNTIISTSKENFGLNPICSLNYGKRISRILVYFDEKSLKDKVSDGTFKNPEKLSHHLKMTNCGTVDIKKFMERDEMQEYLSSKRRASSFDIIAFKVPQAWDAGDGFDNSTDTWFLGYKSVSKNGSTWEQSMNGVKWRENINVNVSTEDISRSLELLSAMTYNTKHLDEKAIEKVRKNTSDCEEYINIITDHITFNKNISLAKDYINILSKTIPIESTPGIYTSEFLWDEYEKWGRGEESIVIGRQHFDYGNENLDIDITDFVNDILFSSGDTKNYGICLAFSPKLELSNTNEEQYINFFSPHTNTFFQPFVETKYDIEINDDRYKFYAGKENKLYFYSIIDNNFVELDELPTCEIDGVKCPVFSDSKGIYYTTYKVPKNERKNTIKYDVWDNLKLNGESLEPVELQFVVLSSNTIFNLGDDIEKPHEINPVISGINDDQKLNQGDVRTITVIYRIPYTTSDYEIINESFYRIYVKNGKQEIDVIDWEPISTLGRFNSFILNTNELLPQDYYVDIKVHQGRETIIFKNKLHFRVVDNITEIKR